MPEDSVALVHLKALMDERDRLYMASFAASSTAVAAALAAQEKAVNAAFLASEKAIIKAEDAQREYNVRSNEFRGQLDDQAKTLMPRPETMNLFKSYDEKIASMSTNFDSKLDELRKTFEKAVERLSGEVASLRESRSQLGGRDAAQHDNRQQSNWIIGLVIGLAVTLAGMGMTIALKLSGH
jgi:hypothetical protein